MKELYESIEMINTTIAQYLNDINNLKIEIDTANVEYQKVAEELEERCRDYDPDISHLYYVETALYIQELKKQATLLEKNHQILVFKLKK